MSELKSFEVEGKSFFASVQSPNKHTGVYSIDLSVDSATQAHLESLGLKPAKRENGVLVDHEGNGNAVFRLKRKVVTREGKTLTPPFVGDSEGKRTTVLIGNGSTVKVRGTAYGFSAPGIGKGTAGGLSSVQIIELVPFEVQEFRLPPINKSSPLE